MVDAGLGTSNDAARPRFHVTPAVVARRRFVRPALVVLLLAACGTSPAVCQEVPAFASLVAATVTLKPSLAGVHPRVFVTKEGLEALRARARTTHRDQWQRVLRDLPATKAAPPPPPGPQARRSQNNVAYAIAGVSLAWAVEQKPEYLAAAKSWTLAAIDYEPWGYTYNKPNVDLAAGHLLYAIGWAYDLLYHDLTGAERARIRASLERHAGLVHDAFAPGKPGKRFNFTQNHDFIPTAGLAVAALALMGESVEAPKWAALARAHHHRANQLLSPDGYYYEGIEYWIFSIPWLVHFYDAWEHSTGESLWELGPARGWKHYLAHSLLPDGQNVFDFGDIWEGPLTRAGKGEEYARVYPGGTLQSNFNVLYRVAAKFGDGEAQAVAERCAGFGHGNLEEYWTLLWRDATLTAAPMAQLPLHKWFVNQGVVYARTSWGPEATAFAVKSGPPEGHHATALLRAAPEWRLSSGHAHPDNGSFIIWAKGRYLTGDTGYAGLTHARHHNTITVGGLGQGTDGDHDVWREMDYARLNEARILDAEVTPSRARIVLDAAGAYDPAAGLTRFTRTFTFTAPGTFTVRDEIAIAKSQPVQFFLQSDTPLQRDGDGWILGRAAAGGAGLRVVVEEPTSATLTTAPTSLMAPGRPGSITSGKVDERGYHLKVETAPATAVTIGVTMTVVE
jgi:hypothetical protein